MRYLIAVIDTQGMPTHTSEEITTIDTFNDFCKWAAYNQFF